MLPMKGIGQMGGMALGTGLGAIVFLIVLGLCAAAATKYLRR
ncbi:hypothetical protein U0C82_17575 [Fulvimarina sp. 2208YS6-2-32]|uniref:Uncharacterized protein n=1 Tax=Fulvimarina uroteuthidis TaxID=3098149 RepID=A0ABU5I6E8_9HYPH|nr:MULTISPECIES: hypothetical protein [Fulvimarina]MDY8110947.1 hypothetical protein [Fulvimarina sp. 2208YS6-2-32]